MRKKEIGKNITKIDFEQEMIDKLLKDFEELKRAELKKRKQILDIRR